jgi:hypothetical protein
MTVYAPSKPVTRIQYLGFDSLTVSKQLDEIRNALGLGRGTPILIANTKYQVRRGPDWKKEHIESLLRDGVSPRKRDKDAVDGVSTLDQYHIEDLGRKYSPLSNFAGEVLAIYDPNQFTQDDGVYRFKNPERRQDALLGVVVFTF